MTSLALQTPSAQGISPARRGSLWPDHPTLTRGKLSAVPRSQEPHSSTTSPRSLGLVSPRTTESFLPAPSHTSSDVLPVSPNAQLSPCTPPASKSTPQITECSGLEGTFRGHLVIPTCGKQGHLQPDQVAQSPVQPGLECFQGWGLHDLSG